MNQLLSFDGTPAAFDAWRGRYGSMSYQEQLEFHEALYARFPEQNHCQLAQARAFAALLPAESRVLEIGGWDGKIATCLLAEFPHIVHWQNFEICQSAVLHGQTHPRYAARVPENYVWELPELPAATVLFAAHVLEHLRSDEIRRLLARLPSVERAYVEAPLPASGARVSWQGNTSTHILELGWQELEQLFAEFGFLVEQAAGDVRFFRRPSHTIAVPGDLTLGTGVVLHPSANLYRSTIGAGTKVAAFVEIGGATIGAHCKIQAHAFIPPGVTLADDVFIGPGVRFTNDRTPRATGTWNCLPTRVERGASVGAGAVVLPGITIGAGAMIGAGSVVVEDVPPGACVAGNPARPTAERRPDHAANDCLLILNPRRIPRAIASLESLPIDQVWFTAYSEEALVPLLNRVIRETRYRNYLLVSDDVVATPAALGCVQNMLQRHPAATGYCRIAANSDEVNLTRSPLVYPDEDCPAWQDYDFYRMDEVRRQGGEFVSWLGGWTLTGMRRELWLAYPFEVNPRTRQQSDAQTALRMGRDGHGFFSHPDAGLEHLKPDREQTCQTGWLVGTIEPSIHWNFHAA